MATRRLGLLALLPGLTVALSCTLNPVTGRKELAFPTVDQEIAIGLQAAPEFEKEFGGKVQNQQLQRYVSSVGASIAAVSDRKMPYEYTLLASDIPNAFALPGGKIYITAGLMKLMNNERELAAVFAHETTHVAALHNVHGLQRQMGTGILVEIADRAAGSPDATAARVTRLVANLANLKYSRDEEYEADKYGVLYASRAGYNPWGMVELLSALQTTEESSPGALGEMFRTHPLTENRISQAKGIVQSEHPAARATEPDPAASRFLQMKALLK